MRTFTLILFGLLALTGCSGKQLAVQSVTGTVTYKGSTIEDALVTFVAKSGDGHGAVAVTDSNGSYILATPGVTKKGAETGEYNVFIVKSIYVDKSGNPLPKGTAISIGSSDDGPAQVMEYPVQKSVIPEKYSDSQKPLLNATVIKRKNVFDFNLED